MLENTYFVKIHTVLGVYGFSLGSEEALDLQEALNSIISKKHYLQNPAIYNLNNNDETVFIRLYNGHDLIEYSVKLECMEHAIALKGLLTQIHMHPSYLKCVTLELVINKKDKPMTQFKKVAIKMYDPARAALLHNPGKRSKLDFEFVCTYFFYLSSENTDSMEKLIDEIKTGRATISTPPVFQQRNDKYLIDVTTRAYDQTNTKGNLSVIFEESHELQAKTIHSMFCDVWKGIKMPISITVADINEGESAMADTSAPVTSAPVQKKQTSLRVVVTYLDVLSHLNPNYFKIEGANIDNNQKHGIMFLSNLSNNEPKPKTITLDLPVTEGSDLPHDPKANLELIKLLTSLISRQVVVTGVVVSSNER